MPYPGNKRKRTATKQTPSYKKKWTPSKRAKRPTIQKMINTVLNRNIETKTALFTASDGTEIAHNNFITLTNTLLKTTQGVTDPSASNTLCRIGDKINLRGVSLKMMVELNERYTDVTFRLMVIKCARGDVPTRSNLFKGISGNKMLDSIETERYTVIGQKWFKIKAGHYGATSADGAGGAPQPSGYSQQAGTTYTRQSKIVTMWLPGAKFGRGGQISYESNGEAVKFFDYHVLLYAYSNYSTLQDLWNVGRLNDYVQTMYYKDA